MNSIINSYEILRAPHLFFSYYVIYRRKMSKALWPVWQYIPYVTEDRKLTCNNMDTKVAHPLNSKKKVATFFLSNFTTLRELSLHTRPASMCFGPSYHFSNPVLPIHLNILWCYPFTSLGLPKGLLQTISLTKFI